MIVSQIKDLIQTYNLNILNLQESHIECDTFDRCHFINTNFNCIQNNSPTNYETTSLIATTLNFDNVRYDDTGRVIIFDLPDFQLTAGNIYLPCRADRAVKNKREEYCSRIIPELMINILTNGIIGGDWKSIISKRIAP